MTKPGHMAAFYKDETVWQRFCQTASTYPDQPFLRYMPSVAKVYGIEAGDTSYQQMRQAAEGRAAVLAAAGLRPGERIGLYLYNRPDFFVNFLAANSLGLSIVPINPDLRSAELTWLIDHSELRLMIAAAAAPPVLAEVCGKAGVPVIAADGVPPSCASQAPLPPAPPEASKTEAALLYTSGTTGLPKGCQLSQEYFLYAGDWYVEMPPPWGLSQASEVMITPLPLFHMNALACSVMAMVSCAGCLVPLDRFHPSSWQADVRDSGATILHYLGVMPSILMQLPESSDDRDHTVRFGFGAGVDRTLHARFEARFGFPLLEAWAMTETGAGACIAATDPDRRIGLNCFGRAEESVEVLIQREDGQPAGRDEPGELLVRRAGADPHFGFFTAYYKNPEATEEAWQGGWFHTGDIVEQDADGFFYFRDRKKNIIRRSGENIAAIEVEAVLARHPDVAQLAVGPVADDLRGDEVACLVVPRNPDQDMQALFDALFALASDQLAYYKAPGWFARVDSLPLTGTQKVQRGGLQKMLVEMAEQGALQDYRAGKKQQKPA